MRRPKVRARRGQSPFLHAAQVAAAGADDAGVGRSVLEPFTDPLSAVLPDGGERARARLRLAGALLFGAGSLTLAAVLAAPDPDASDHPALIACAAAYALIAVVLTLWSRPPRAVLHAICPAGTIAATAAVAFAEPIGLTPIFYLWPMLVAAYFLGRAEVAANLALVAASCGTALVLWTEPVLRIGIFIAVLAIVGVVTAVVVVLREQVLALVLRLRALASHDSLTGALNRGAFEQRMDAELARASRSSTALSLVVFDVDHFKNLNDSYGHAAGDAALRGIPDVVASGMRPRTPGATARALRRDGGAAELPTHGTRRPCGAASRRASARALRDSPSPPPPRRAHGRPRRRCGRAS